MSDLQRVEPDGVWPCLYTVVTWEHYCELLSDSCPWHIHERLRREPLYTSSRLLGYLDTRSYPDTSITSYLLKRLLYLFKKWYNIDSNRSPTYSRVFLSTQVDYIKCIQNDEIYSRFSTINI